MDGCPFCKREMLQVLLETERAMVITAKFPDAKGHLLVVPKRHVEDYFDLEWEEQESMASLLAEARQMFFADEKPEGFSVKINVGRIAGQRVMHAHMHLIPRRPEEVVVWDGADNEIKGLYRTCPTCNGGDTKYGRTCSTCDGTGELPPSRQRVAETIKRAYEAGVHGK